MKKAGESVRLGDAAGIPTHSFVSIVTTVCISFCFLIVSSICLAVAGVLTWLLWSDLLGI